MSIKGFFIIEFLAALLIITCALLGLFAEQLFINRNISQMQTELHALIAVANQEETKYATD
ncbi:MAG: hypothetical protein A3E88_07145 [Legionellales bacterium RIFCSPHIGHO2_12_FULL_35_11]|nr:MAG: hypothetical protein A3E88_07145 [Legionellales bacterium RIFCSPHIGHO2_12_FULL_35_11]